MAIATTRAPTCVAGQTRTTSASLSIGSHRSSLISIVAQIYNIHLTCITEDTFFLSRPTACARARHGTRACSRTGTIGRVSHLRHLSIRKTSFRFSHFSLSRREISHRVAARDDHLPPGQGNRIACWPTKEIGKGTRKCYVKEETARETNVRGRFSVWCRMCGEGCELRVCACACACACGTCVCRRDISFL